MALDRAAVRRTVGLTTRRPPARRGNAGVFQGPRQQGKVADYGEQPTFTCASCAASPLSPWVFRARLAAIHGRLHDLESCCPPGHVAGLADALEALEAELASLGSVIPETALTRHDKAVLRSLGCPA